MADETDWHRELFPNGQQRTSYHQDQIQSGSTGSEMTNFGVIQNQAQQAYQGQGPGYIAPDYEDEAYYPPPPGQQGGQPKQYGISMARESSGGMISNDTSIDQYGIIMADLPSRREQSAAVTLRRRPTHRSGRRPINAVGGRDSPQFVDDEPEGDDVLPSLRRESTRDGGAGIHRSPAARRPSRPPAHVQPEGQRISGYRQVKWQLGLRWKQVKESLGNFFYHLGLWRNTMKQVEGRFGTGVVSYFLFLRWLVFLDLILSLLVVSFIFIPQVSKGERTLTSELQNSVPSTEWYSYIQQTISGKGYLEDTELFYGVYTNKTLTPSSYSMPYAYMFTVFGVLAVSLVLLVWSMSKAYRESYTQDSGNLYSYSNKTFGAWEFTITDESTARLKSISIKKDFEEELNYEKAIGEKWPLDRTMRAYARRVIINLIIMLMWVAAGTSIYFATVVAIEANEERINNNGQVLGYTDQFVLFAKGLAATLTIAAFDIIFPTVFQQLALWEMWRTPRTEVRATLLRTIAMRLSSLGVLMASVFIQIDRCNRPMTSSAAAAAANATTLPTSGTSAPLVMTSAGASAVSMTAATTAVTTAAANASDNCQPCWESFAGQEIYQLVIIDFFIVVLLTLFGETIWRFAADRSKLIKDKIGPPEFFIAKSVLELLYSQALLWLGVYFAPLICVICIMKFIVFFYSKRWSLFHNLKPTDRPYRAARNSNIFRALLLLTLFLCLIPVGYGIVRITPSQGCGPFRGKVHVYDIIPELVAKAPGWLNTVINFLGSAAFLAPLFILLILVIYYYYALSKAQLENIRLLKDQLQLEGRDKQFLIGKVQRMQTTLAALSQ